MTAPASRSNRRLLLLLAALVLPPVLLVLGPFRAKFFPGDTHAVQALARVHVPPLDAAAFAEFAAGRFTPAEVAELLELWRTAQYDALVERLGREPRERMAPGLKFLHGEAALLARRPAIATKGLTDAKQEGDPALRLEATFALAQALLLTGNATAAREELAPLAAATPPAPHQEEAAAQIAAIDALLRSHDPR